MLRRDNAVDNRFGQWRGRSHRDFRNAEAELSIHCARRTRSNVAVIAISEMLRRGISSDLAVGKVACCRSHRDFRNAEAD